MNCLPAASDPPSTEENVHSRSALARARARNRARSRRSANSLRSGKAARPAHQSKAALGDWVAPIPRGPEIVPPTEPNLPSDFVVRRDCDDIPNNGKKRPGAGQSPLQPGSSVAIPGKSGVNNKDHAGKRQISSSQTGITLADEKSNEYRRRSAKDSHAAYSKQEADQREKIMKARTTTQRSNKRNRSTFSNKKSNTNRRNGKQSTQSSGTDGTERSPIGTCPDFSSGDPMEATTQRTTSGQSGMQQESILANRKNNVHWRRRARASQHVTTRMSGAMDTLRNETPLEERPSQTPAVSEHTIEVDTPPAFASNETMSMDYAAPLHAFVVERSSRDQAERNEERVEQMIPSHLCTTNAPLVDAAVVDENDLEAATCGILKSPKEYVRRNQTCVGATLVVALALIAMIGTLMGIYIPPDDTEGASEKPVLSLTSTPSPTSTPTRDPTEERFNYIKKILTDASVSGEEELDDKLSPQYHALEWLSKTDPLQLSLDEEKHLIQRYILATFYFATGGEYWTKTYNFLGNEHECNWFGLAKQNRWNFTEEGCFCSKGISSGDVDYIHMIKNNLTGMLPSELMNLPSLKVLFLYENNLSGTVPESLGELRFLEQLSLDENRLTGTIPSSLGGLPSLKKLSLYGNQLNGTIPDTFGNLSSLVELSLDQNLLSGHIPEIFLELTGLRDLSLYENGLTGQIPKTLGKSLELIDLSDNQLSGPIPDTVGHLVRLRELYFKNNRLNGTLPSALGNLTSLEHAFFYDNELTGHIPNFWSRLTLLRRLFLNENTLSGKIPETLGKLTSLIALYLHQNDLTGHIPESLKHLKRLQNLYLFDNKISGIIPSSVGNMTSLVVLALHRNILSGPLPDSFGKLTLLQKLYLYKNEMNGTLPATLGHLSSLINLELNDNSFFGHVPESLGNLNLLENLFLHKNDLDGTIPSTFGKHLASLKRLYLYSNGLTGTVPASLGNLTSLEKLYIDGNFLNGTFPEEVCDLSDVIIWADCLNKIVCDEPECCDECY